MGMTTRLSLFLLACVGCASRTGVVADAFPPAALASPWELQGTVWSGTFEEATNALGDETPDWRRCEPTHAWIAKYCHVQTSHRCLTVRIFAFNDRAHAERAYTFFQPKDPRPFKAGDAGCWTDFGVLIRWGRLVIDVFGPAASLDDQLQSGLLAGFLVNGMPTRAPDNPR
jgi:hypothetical protein